MIVPIYGFVPSPFLPISRHPEDGVLFHLHHEDKENILKPKRQWIRDQQTKQQKLLKIQLEDATNSTAQFQLNMQVWDTCKRLVYMLLFYITLWRSTNISNSRMNLDYLNTRLSEHFASVRACMHLNSRLSKCFCLVPFSLDNQGCTTYTCSYTQDW